MNRKNTLGERYWTRSRIMRIRTFAITVLILVLWQAASIAEHFTSLFGFTVNVPSHWVVINSRELENDPELSKIFDSIFPKNETSVKKNIRNMILDGKLEVYYNLETATENFSDNVTLGEDSGTVPISVEQSEAACESLAKNLTKLFGKSITLYACNTTHIAGSSAWFVEFDGLTKGIRTITYHIQRSLNTRIVLTATCRVRNLKSFRKDLHTLLASMQIRHIT